MFFSRCGALGLPEPQFPDRYEMRRKITISSSLITQAGGSAQNLCSFAREFDVLTAAPLDTTKATVLMFFKRSESITKLPVPSFRPSHSSESPDHPPRDQQAESPSLSSFLNHQWLGQPSSTDCGLSPNILPSRAIQCHAIEEATYLPPRTTSSSSHLTPASDSQTCQEPVTTFSFHEETFSIAAASPLLHVPSRLLLLFDLCSNTLPSYSL